MKIKENFALRQVADVWVVLPLAEATLDLNGMLTLNDSGVLLWKCLEKGCTQEDLVVALMDEYEVTYQQAIVDIETFVTKLHQVNCIEE